MRRKTIFDWNLVELERNLFSNVAALGTGSGFALSESSRLSQSVFRIAGRAVPGTVLLPIMRENRQPYR